MSTTSTTNSTTNSKYTYAQFANDVITLIDSNPNLVPEEYAQKMKSKAQDLLTAQEKKSEYNATHKSAKTPKGPSAETKERADAIAEILSSTPMTASEISSALNTNFNALQVANAVKYIPSVQTTKVIRETFNAKGLKAQKEYTAYFIG